MPRQARLDALGTPHHVMIRGIEDTDIFCDDECRGDFTSQLFDNHDDAVVLFPVKVNNEFFQPVQLPNNGAGAIRFEQSSPHGLIHFECSQFTTLNVDKSVVSSLKQICTFRLRSLRIFPKMNQECSSQMIQIIFILTNCTGGVS